MKGKNKTIRLLTLIMSVILLVSLFGTAATASADEDDDIVYYDEDRNILIDPCNADECYSENLSGNLTLTDCPTCETDNESAVSKSIPPGQMVRRGLSGPVVAVNVTDDGYYYFLVQTNFGIVKVVTNQTTNQTVNTSMIGQRVAVKLEKVGGGASTFAHNGTGNGTASEYGNIYRVATALQFRLIPSKGEMKHKWGTVESSGQECVFVDEDGIQIPVKCGKSSGNVIGLVGGSGNGTGGNGTSMLLQTQQMSKIQARLQLRIKQAEDEGDEVTLAKLNWKFSKFEAKQLRLEEKKAARGEKGLKKGKNK